MKRNLLLATLAAVASVSHAATILISPPSSTVANGSNFEIEVLASDVPIGAFDVDIAFNPTILSLVDAGFDANLGAPVSLQNWAAGSGSVNLSEVSFLSADDLAPLQSGTYRLARLSFTASVPGMSDLVFSHSVVSDPAGNMIFPDLVEAVVTVSAPAQVPEPRSSALMLGGCLLLAGVEVIRKRARFASSAD